MQVESQWTNKDYVGAQRSSLHAKLWSIAAIVAGVLVVTVFIASFAVCVADKTSSCGTYPDNE